MLLKEFLNTLNSNEPMKILINGKTQSFISSQNYEQEIINISIKIENKINLVSSFGMNTEKPRVDIILKEVK
jgi:hypothetical protein